MRLSRNNSLIDLTPLEEKPFPPNLPDAVNQALLHSPDFIKNCQFNNLHEFSRTLSKIDRYTTHSAMIGILGKLVKAHILFT